VEYESIASITTFGSVYMNKKQAASDNSVPKGNPRKHPAISSLMLKRENNRVLIHFQNP